jgi:hypothetical protein
LTLHAHVEVPAANLGCQLSSEQQVPLRTVLQAGMDEGRITEKLQAAAPKLAAWLQAYMRQQPNAPASTAGPGFNGPATKALCIQVRRGPWWLHHAQCRAKRKGDTVTDS